MRNMIKNPISILNANVTLEKTVDQSESISLTLIFKLRNQNQQHR